jgi:hypothetical protein
MTSLVIGSVSMAQALTRTWSGGAVGAWTDGANWSPSGTPAASDDVIVGPGSTVTNAQNSYKTMDVQSGATVKFAGEWVGSGAGATTVSGVLGRDTAGTMRLGSALNLSGHLAATPTWFDTQGKTMTFTDGAAFDNANMSVEHRYNNTFGFKLSASGFKTIIAGRLWSAGSVTWANVTYNIDISDYDLRSGLRIVLMDFNGHDALYNSGFGTATVNVIAGSSGLSANLSFDTSTSQLVLTFPYPLTWSGGGDGANWLDRLNWVPTNLPTISDDVLIGAGATVTNAQAAFKTLEVRTNATVTLAASAGQSGIGARTVNLAGALGVHAGSGNVVRMNGATINLSGQLSATISFLDMSGGTINYTNGAAFGNANMGFEHKGWNTFRYTLATNGFTTMACGRLYSGNNGQFAAAWSNATYAIDVSRYAGSRPAEIVLADYNGHDSIFANAFNPVVTVTGLDGGKLRFDTATSRLILKVSGSRGTLISLW